MSYLKAIEAGVDVLDTCLSPFALRTSQPAIEPLIVAWSRPTGRPTWTWRRSSRSATTWRRWR